MTLSSQTLGVYAQYAVIAMEHVACDSLVSLLVASWLLPHCWLLQLHGLGSAVEQSPHSFVLLVSRRYLQNCCGLLRRYWCMESKMPLVQRAQLLALQKWSYLWCMSWAKCPAGTTSWTPGVQQPT